MKIIIFLENIQCGGVDTFCENLINYWPNKNDEFVFICNQSHPGLVNIKNNIKSEVDFIDHKLPISWHLLGSLSPIIPYKVSRIFRPLIRLLILPIQFYMIRGLFIDNQGDALLSISGGYPGGETCRIASIVWGMRGLKGNVYNFHNLAQLPKFGLGWYEFIMDKLLSKYVELFIGVSKVCAESLRIRSNFKRLDNLRYIYNGVGVLKNNRKNINLRAVYNIPDNAFICLMLATYEKRKGHEFIFKAFKIASKHIDNAHLIVCGGGSEIEIKEVERLKTSLVPNHNVHLAGFIPNGSQLISQADVLLIGSQEFESFGLTAIEAMQQKVPVVSTNVGGLQEVIGVNGENGLLTRKNDVEKFANNIIELHSNKDLYKDITRRAKIRFTDRFTPEKMARQYMEAITLLNNKEDE